ncbi:MAG: hypothetical protein OQJ89_06245 [Kangiellaceae bacterium]|nr:hypothetical protein [Kangiellaceae bacterium]
MSKDETNNELQDAICREKQIKKWNREKKVNLIESINPKWESLL